MFKDTPRIFAHKSITDQGNFVLPDYILNAGTGDNSINLFHRFCPHRMFPLHNPGEHVENIFCEFHGFEWSKDGTPINNPKKIHCGKLDIGRSGLVFKNFIEPDHKWVDDLAKETNLVYSHSYQGESKGSWLWMMDAEADVLHIHDKGIHPFLSKQVKAEDIQLDQGDDWILQTHPNGWWLYVFPFSFIEYGNNGCVMVNRIVPNDINTEYGYKWISQYYYDPNVNVNTKYIFETAEQVFIEDVKTSEKQKGNYFPVINPMNKYEDHCVHFGQWVARNKIS
jgi:hypothetical protein